jgi:rhodanese-related sulfurtransferase
MKATKRILIFLLAMGALAMAACGQAEQAGGGAKTIAPAALAQRIAAGDAPVVLDVRTPEEYAAGHIPGAVNIPHDQLESRVGELGADPGAEIVVHCQSGRRASMAEGVLHDAGFTNVVDLEGHMAAWKDGGHPVE